MVTQSAGHEYPQQAFDAVPVRMKTGSYTGDGATSQAITGVGFKPKYVKVWRRGTVSGGTSVWLETTTDIIDDIAAGASHKLTAADHTIEGDTIISLDADGFTVDDAGVDADPNTSGTVYNYLALG